MNESIRHNVFCSFSQFHIVKLGNIERRKNSRIPLILANNISVSNQYLMVASPLARISREWIQMTHESKLI